MFWCWIVCGVLFSSYAKHYHKLGIRQGEIEKRNMWTVRWKWDKIESNTDTREQQQEAVSVGYTLVATSRGPRFLTIGYSKSEGHASSFYSQTAIVRVKLALLEFRQ